MSAPALLVEDHPLFGVGLHAAWIRDRTRPPLHVVRDLRSALAWSEGRALSMAVVDLALPDGCGLDLIAPLARRGVPVAVLSTDLRPAVALAARRLGAVAVLSKELDPADLLRYLDRVRVGSVLADPAGAASVPPLTPREREVLGALLDGRSNPEIADQLGIGVETVKTHVTALMGRFDAHGRHEVGQRARDLGFDVALPYLGEDPEPPPR